MRNRETQKVCAIWRIFRSFIIFQFISKDIEMNTRDRCERRGRERKSCFLFANMCEWIELPWNMHKSTLDCLVLVFFSISMFNVLFLFCCWVFVHLKFVFMNICIFCILPNSASKHWKEEEERTLLKNDKKKTMIKVSQRYAVQCARLSP